MKIALCEDNIRDQELMKDLLKEWQAKSGQFIEVQVFSDSVKLMGAIDEHYQAFDVYLLDIEMKTVNEGIDLARKIRVKSNSIPFIFTTSHREVMSVGFDLNATHFLVKPISKVRLFTALETITKKIQEQSNDFFHYVFEGISTRIPLNDIFYISTIKGADHYLAINGDDDRRIRSKLSDLVSEYPQYLVICHQSHLVNIKKVQVINSNMLKLLNGTELSISRSNLKTVRQRFAELYSPTNTED